MTMRPKKRARRWVSITMIPILSVSAYLLSPSTDSTACAGSLLPSQVVFPRAGVSSEAYMTRSTRWHQPAQTHQAHRETRQQPQHLSTQQTDRSIKSEPARLIHASSARPLESRSQVVPVQHQSVEPVGARRDNRQSVRTELERLYAEEGRQMPQMPVVRHQPQPLPTSNPAIVPNAHTPSELTYRREGSEGVLAGLFDFGRKDRRRRSSAGMPMRPPEEPQPFRPPSYRQQQQAARAAQPKPQSQAPAARKQTTMQSKQSADVFTLRKGSQAPSPRNFDEPSAGFFPEDPRGLPKVNPGARSQQVVIEEDLDVFFPDDTAQPQTEEPSSDAASDSMKAKLNDLLNSQPQEMAEADSPAAESEDAFQMPEEAGNGEIVEPPAAPAAMSEVVTTKVAPVAPTTDSPTESQEPAPFFAAGERAINPQENMDIAALKGQTFDPSGADSEETAGTIANSEDAGSRMQQIAARDGVGLKGFCPVALRDERALKDGRAAFVSFYRSQPYYFSSMAAKARFDADPQQYAPAAGGQDVTMKSLTGEVMEGSLDHSVWYKDRLYLFHSAENLATFMAAPSAMALSH